MLAEDALKLGGNRLERAASTHVPGVGLELDALVAEPERVLEHEELCLDIRAGSPRARAKPGPADLDPRVLGMDPQVGGAAEHASVFPPNGREGPNVWALRPIEPSAHRFLR